LLTISSTVEDITSNILGGICCPKKFIMLSVFISGKNRDTYGISVNRKMIAGKIARIKLKATPLARSRMSSSSRFFKNILRIL
jgi:hypothetical protein